MVYRTAFLAAGAILAGAVATGAAGAAPDGELADRWPPSPPRVFGPRRTAETSPTYRFVARDRGGPAAALRFRCSFDAIRLHGCARRYRQELGVGRHVLRVQAVDRAGNRSRVTRVGIEIVTPAPPTAALRVAARISVGGAPLDVAVGEGAVWVANSGSNSVSRIDPRTNTVVASISMGAVGELAVGFGSVWVTDPVNGAVRRIDPRTNSVVATVPLGLQPLDIAAGEGAVWITSLSATGLARVDPATNSAAHVPGFAVGGLVGAVAAGGGAVWAKVGDLFKLDPRTAAVAGRVSIDAVVRSIALGEGAVWVGLGNPSVGAPLLARVDPRTLAVRRILAGTPCTGVTGVATGGGAVWVATGRIGSAPPCSLLKVDPATDRVVAQLPPAEGRDVAAVAVGEGSVWAVDRVSDRLLRIALE